LAGRRRIVAVAAVVVVAAAVLGFEVLPSASASDGVGTAHAPDRSYGAAPAPLRLPPGARRTTRNSLPAPGARAKPFADRAAQPRISGGTTANPADYPWIVGIETVFTYGADHSGNFVWYTSVCTGTVLSATKVLTTGICSVGLSLATSVVIAGRSDLSDDNSGYVARVKSTWTDPSFNYWLYSMHLSVPVDDVTVLTLTDPLPPAYTPVPLAPDGSPTAYNEDPALAVGYGNTANGATDFGILRQATLPIRSAGTCSGNTYPYSGYDNSRMLCAGTLGAPQSPGAGACSGDFGGPILVNGVQVGIADWGPTDCGVGYLSVYERISTYRSLIDADVANPGVINADWSGDGHSDLLARDRNGVLIEYSGSGHADAGGGSAFTVDAGVIGSGWNGFNKLFRVMNWDGDGTPAIMARTPNGKLYKYKSDGAGGFASGQPTPVGTGWGTFTDIMVTNNWTGDGRPNILGRNAKGDLYLYTSDGHGGWLNNGLGTRIGTAWNQFDTVLTPGDWKGDGHQGLIGRTPKGELFLYESDGHGSWLNNGVGQRIGTAWNQFKTFLSPGDFAGDDKIDLIGITPGGVLNLYSTDGHGNWLDHGNGRKIGSGWSAFTAVF
jgi:hypothetical protein